MKAIIKIILLAVVTLIMVGCVEHYKETKINSDYSVRIIDSCEYISCPTYYGFPVYSHKGNCRFCAERRKQELEALVKQIKEK